MTTQLSVYEIQQLENVPGLDFSELGKTEEEMIEDLANIAVSLDYHFFMELLNQYSGDLEKRENHFFRFKCFQRVSEKKSALEKSESSDSN